MKIHVALKIARQYEGEYIFIQGIKGFFDPLKLDDFLKDYKYAPAETINGVECIVEPGVIEIEVEDIDDLLGKEKISASSIFQDMPIQWKNLRKMPEAQIANGQFPTLKNPEVLSWTDLGNDKKEGRGLVWVDQNSPLISIDPETFLPTKYYGELRLFQGFNKGRYGPIVLEPAQPGDFLGKEEVDPVSVV